MGEPDNQFSILPNILSTRNLILRSFCGIYLCAFLSFYIQAEGLYSPVVGITPTQVDIIRGDTPKDKVLSFIERPSWLRVFKHFFGIATFTGIEIVSLLGILTAFLGFVTKKFCTAPIFFLLWTLYFSLVDIAGEFHQQTDDLLLEAGIVCILLAPGFFGDRYGVSDNVMLMLMRWVLFRFLFSSGAVKLSSGCPHWWNLSAMKHHLLTLPMPTNLAFYAYYIPEGLLKVTTIYVNLSELLCPWLFFAPIRSLRIFAFYWQIFLQLCIIATGNYGFLNFMIIVMLFSLLDDSHFFSKTKQNGFKKTISLILTLLAIVFIVITTLNFYEITMVNGKIDAQILIEKKEYMDLLRHLVKFAPFIAVISLINVFLQSCISHPSIYKLNGFFAKLSKIIQLLALSMVAIALVGCATVPHGNLHPETNITTTSIGNAVTKGFNKYHVVHEWGMHLRKMRSERLELEFQYTYDDASDTEIKPRWRTYDVTYRPILENSSMPFAGPYFSRVDFRFHKAVGQGAKFAKNLWLAGLTKQLLKNSRAALSLLSHENVKTVVKPPKFVRVAFIRLKYVPLAFAEKKNGLWIRSVLNADYIPPMKLGSEELNDVLAKLNLPKRAEKETFPKLLEILEQTRIMFDSAADGHMVVLGVLFASCLILFRIRRRSYM